MSFKCIDCHRMNGLMIKTELQSIQEQYCSFVDAVFLINFHSDEKTGELLMKNRQH